MKRPSWLLGILGCLVLALGCAKQIPSPDMKFGAQDKVVLSFRGGEQVLGRIDTGNKVELREPGVVWKAQIGEVSDDRIVLKDLVRIRDDKGVALQSARVKDARLGVTGRVPDKTFLRNEISGVSFVKTDPSKTARTVTFWTYGAVVLALLLKERS